MLPKRHNAHHAYVIRIGGSYLPSFKKVLEREWGIHVRANPDFREFITETFTVNDARMLSESESRRAFVSIRIFIIAAQSISPEAQNALLKLFEEPQEGTIFFIVIPPSATLLPTLLSRMMVLFPTEPTSDQFRVNEFLALSKSERLKKIAELVESVKEGASGKDLYREFLLGVEREVYTTFQKSGVGDVALRSIIQAKKDIEIKGASAKLILEHVALTL